MNKLSRITRVIVKVMEEQIELIALLYESEIPMKFEAKAINYTVEAYF